MTRAEFITWATANGWCADRYGHLQKTEHVRDANGQGPIVATREYRMKLSSIAARYEVKSGAGWVRLRSGYYSKLAITAEGKLGGMAF